MKFRSPFGFIQSPCVPISTFQNKSFVNLKMFKTSQWVRTWLLSQRLSVLQHPGAQMCSISLFLRTSSFTICVYVDVGLWELVVCHMGAGSSGGQKRVSDSLELKLQGTVSFLMWVLGTELWSLPRAVHILNP